MINDQFLRSEHKGIWEVVDTPEEVIVALQIKRVATKSGAKLQRSNSPVFLFL